MKKGPVLNYGSIIRLFYGEEGVISLEIEYWIVEIEYWILEIGEPEDALIPLLARVLCVYPIPTH